MSSRKNKSSTRHSRKRATQNINVNTLTLEKVMTDAEIESKTGEFFDRSHYKIIINSDTDVYYLHNGRKKLLCSFRKNVIPQDVCESAYDALVNHAKKWNSNRGAAAGKLDMEKMPGYVERLTQADKYRAYYYSKIDGKFHKDHISNLTQSNIIGFYDKGDRITKNNIPCRETLFNRKYPKKWESVQPFIRSVAKMYEKLVPHEYEKQYKQASETPDYQIKGTPFSTATINYNWRTALHRDRGDYEAGFGNLTILEHGNFEGGFLGFPQYGVAVEVRQGDFLAMDVHQYHCNTELIYHTPDAVRLSIVCYLRDKMIRCKGA